jgi:1,2-diacylglycerol 3-alpha-glucosyltransferase
MNILMMTNTYAPHVGGVARSVESFARGFRGRGHRVVVVAPEFDGMSSHEADVVRVPALKHFHGSDFSLRLPAPGLLTKALAGFKPDVVHAHHPFLLGDTALVVARVHGAPLVFTHHTLYENYTHNIPGDSAAARRFVVRFAAGFANLADRVFAPSRSLADLLRERGVRTAISVVPTGVDLDRWRNGDGARYRRGKGIPAGDVLVGHLGRLSLEKNLDFLAASVIRFMKKRGRARFLLIGAGPAAGNLEEHFEREGLSDRLIREGVLGPEALSDALHALDVFAFASLSETQGMVLTEAMACGVPVVALNGPGVRDVVEDGVNGFLLKSGADERAFAAALEEAVLSGPIRSAALRRGAIETAAVSSLKRSVDKALAAYGELASRKAPEPMPLEAARRWAAAEWSVLRNVARSALEAVHDRPS